MKPRNNEPCVECVFRAVKDCGGKVERSGGMPDGAFCCAHYKPQWRKDLGWEDADYGRKMA